MMRRIVRLIRDVRITTYNHIKGILTHDGSLHLFLFEAYVVHYYHATKTPDFFFKS